MSKYRIAGYLPRWKLERVWLIVLLAILFPLAESGAALITLNSCDTRNFNGNCSNCFDIQSGPVTFTNSGGCDDKFLRSSAVMTLSGDLNRRHLCQQVGW